MEASSGGTLELDNTIANTNGTANGTIEAFNGGTVTSEWRDHQRGNPYHRRHRRGTGRGGAELNGSTNTITNAGNLQDPEQQHVST